MSDNLVVLRGTLSRPTIRYTGTGKAVASFQVRVKQGWIDCVAWEAEALKLEGQQEGVSIKLEGYLQKRSWDDKKTGKKQYKVEVVVNDGKLIVGGAHGNSSSGKQDKREAESGDDYDPFA